MQINPYLVFDGRCEAAFKFYEQVLGGKITRTMTHAPGFGMATERFGIPWMVNCEQAA